MRLQFTLRSAVAVVALAAVAAASVAATLAILTVGQVSAGGKLLVCDNGASGGIGPITSTVDNNIRVSGTCTVTTGGVINGNVGVPGATLGVTGSATVNGNINAGGRAEVNLGEGATVIGNVNHSGASGFVDFTAAGTGATVNKNLNLTNTILKASGDASNNRVDGNINCSGTASPSGGAGTGNATDWDGDAINDGTVGKRYKC